MRTICTALFGAFSLLACMVATSRAAPLTVTLNSCPASTLTGFVGAYPNGGTGSMRQFLGIPYAAPPTGANRWLPPKPVTCWPGSRDAKTFGSSCPQGGGTNEDCLFVNVFTKDSGTISNQPVMVFIHGGALIAGSSSFQLNPASLVAKNVVVVTINYRLGALGFLAHPALDNVSQKRTGNYGIQDQIAALKWVQANIANFGGDPNNVTIFGQSAGGLSVLVHLISPLSNGLFHKAIIQSGALYHSAMLLADAEAAGNNFAANVGCGNGSLAAQAACLRALSPATILANQSVLGASTRLLRQDNVLIRGSLRDLLSTGKFKKIPVINGSTHDEARFNISTSPVLGTGGSCNFTSNIVPDDQANFAGAVTVEDALITAGNMPSSLATEAVQEYPPGATPRSANSAYAEIITDVGFACRTLRVNKWLAQFGSKNYGYELNEAQTPPSLFPPFNLRGGGTLPYRAHHGADLSYLFRMRGLNNACGAPIAALSPDQNQLAAAMVTYWTTFAKTGNPNPAAGTKPPNWPLFNTAGNNMLSFVAPAPKAIRRTDFDADHKCASFWDERSP